MPQYKKDRIKERIDAAALQVFAQEGFQAAKINDISAQAGVSVGNIYRYYKNKDEIFYGVVSERFPEEFLRVIFDKISEAANSAGNSDSLREVTAFFIRFMGINRDRIRIILSG
jgi:AcrR family transcriptional regulator